MGLLCSPCCLGALLDWFNSYMLALLGRQMSHGSVFSTHWNLHCNFDGFGNDLSGPPLSSSRTPTGCLLLALWSHRGRVHGPLPLRSFIFTKMGWTLVLLGHISRRFSMLLFSRSKNLRHFTSWKLGWVGSCPEGAFSLVPVQNRPLFKAMSLLSVQFLFTCLLL